MSYLDKYTIDGTNYDIRDTTGENIADAYSSSATYAVGDYCWYGGTLYKCIITISTAEEWTAAHWSEVNVIDEVKAANAAKAALIAETATGSIASFSDGSDGLPVKDLTIAINPKQAGSGDPSPSNVRAISGWTGANVTRAGKNLLNPEIYGNPLPYTNRQVTYSKVRDGVYHANGTATGGDSYWNVTFTNNAASSMPSKQLVGKYLYLSTNVDNIRCGMGYYKADGTTGALTNGAQLPSNAVGLRCYVIVANGVSIDTDFSVQLEISTTATDHEPYAATTYPITFPAAAGTVYGGSLDVTTGVLTVTHGMIASYAGETLPGEWISSMDVYTSGVTPTTGAQVVYELSTPVTYQCTPTEVATLLGKNNIWADTGDSAVTYLADTKLYIDNAIAALQALVLEN